MEFGGVGRSRDRVTVIAGSLRAATAVKLSRLKEAWGISRAAVAKEAIVFFLFYRNCKCLGARSAAREATRSVYVLFLPGARKNKEEDAEKENKANACMHASKRR
jgi:hypothetical protein